MKKSGVKRGGVGAALVLGLACGHAAAAESLDQLKFSLLGGTPNLDLRLRYEHADDAMPPVGRKQADATTLRTRLGYTSGKWNQLDAMVELEHTASFGTNLYTQQPGLGTSRPVVADPEGSELNQWWLRYTGLPGTTAQLGRARLILDNARWIGNVGWRQNEQTYDGVFLNNKSVPDLEIQAAWLRNVNMIFYRDVNPVIRRNAPLEGYVLNLGWSPIPQLKLSAYGYALDFTQNLAARRSTSTYGLRAAGAAPLGEAFKFTYAAEYAMQDAEAQAAPALAEREADYALAELGLAHQWLQFKLGYELLGSDDGAYGLQTPLATLHAFNGWADLFLNTPLAGLTDSYVSLGSTVLGTTLAAVWHQYGADEGGGDYGQELNLSASYPVNKQLAVMLKYADYNAVDTVVPTAVSALQRVADTERFWLQFEFKF